MAEIVKRSRHDGYFNSVKRSKHDSLKLTVGSYLSRRHYSENDIRKKAISCEEMIVSQLIDKEVARPNSILFSNSTYRNCFNNDPNPIQVESYFYKFVSWINGLPNDNIKNDLSELVCPLFCHLYLDLVQSNNQQSANLFKFYQEQKNIKENETCSSIIKEFTWQDVKSRPLIKNFRSTKYRLMISLEAINVLKSYLAKHGHILILQALQSWFNIEINNDDNNTQSDDVETENLPICNGDISDQAIDADMMELQEAIRGIEDLPPALLHINLFNSQDNSTCGLTSEKDEKVVIGYSTSEIRVWGLGNTLLPCSKITNDAARIRLACDKMEEEEEDDFNENNLTNSGAAILRGHRDSIQDVRIISEADVLLSVSQDCTLRAWKLSDYSCAAVYRGHNYPIWCLDTSSLGIYMATGSADKSVRIWSLENLYPIRIGAGHTKDVNCLSFHPNGSYLASGSADKSIRMWSVSAGKTVRLFVGHNEGIYSVIFSPDGKYVASGGEDHCIKIWDLTAAKQLAEISNIPGCIHHMSWNKNGSHLACATSDGCVRVWNSNILLKQGNSHVEPTSLYNTSYKNLLSLKYDTRWLTCLSATTTF